MQIDSIEGRDEFRTKEENEFYDYQLVKMNIAKMKQMSNDRDFVALANVLTGLYNQSVVHNTIDKLELFNQTHYGTKVLVQQYIEEIKLATRLVMSASPQEFDFKMKLNFLQRLDTSFGKTALCLSGGASLAFHHFGVIRALVEAKCLPRIISGASGGAMVGGWLCVRSDQEVLDLFTPEMSKYITPSNDSWLTRIMRFFRSGALFSWEDWIEMTRFCCKGDTTFAEAYAMSGRIFNIPVTSLHKYSTNMVLNHISAPNVVLWSAILASSAIPTILTKVTLYKKENGKVVPFLDFGACFADGSIKNDLPFKQLAELFQVKFFFSFTVKPTFSSYCTCCKRNGW